MNVIKRFILLFVVLGITVSAFIVMSRLAASREFVLASVPYTGIYNSYPSTGSGAVAAYTIIQYWRQYDDSLPNPSLSQLDKYFPLSRIVFPQNLAEYLGNIGFETKFVRSYNTADLAQVLREEQSPLIFLGLMDPGYRGRYTPHRVLVGVKDGRLLVHDMYLGPAYPLSESDWKKSFSKEMTENYRYSFLAARPKNYKEILANKTLPEQPYPDRSEYDQFKNAVIRWVESLEDDVDPSFGLAWRMEAINDPVFPMFSPAMRTRLLSGAAFYLNQLGRFEEGRKFAEQAIALNDNLDEPFGIWSGYPTKQIPHPWAVLGDSFFGLGQKEKAAEAYRKAIAIDPSDTESEWARQARKRLSTL